MLKNLCPLLFRTRNQLSCSVIQWQNYHTTQTRMADFDPKDPEQESATPKKFLTYNDIVYPPQKPGEPARPAEICHMRANIRGNHKYLWYGAVMVRGLSVDEAIKQCTFHKKAYAQVIKEVIQEAQEMAVRDHNVEYKSNLWVADSFCTKGQIIKGKRLHARGRFGIMCFQFCHYFVRLREGTPPKHYYPPEPTGNQKLEEYIAQQRRRKILDSL